MSDVRDLLVSTARDVFGREDGVDAAVEAAGLQDLRVDGEVDLGDLAAVIGVAAASATDFGERLLPEVVDERHRLALLRAIQMAATLERVRDLTVEYTKERQQFGQPLHRFQAVQMQLATLAGLAALARASADEAVADPTAERVAVAKVMCGRAATEGAALAHQVHGAIGFTYEHQLHRFTTLLWRWRDEGGSEAEWSAALGTLISERPDQLWEATVDD
ncbi:MAG TPA: acyl-CoA dehydrogenase family protein [Candidatus Dormibacteraeota bacterium]